MNTQIKVLLGQSSMLSLELAYRAIKEMVPSRLINEFEAETGPFIGYPRGEFAITSAGVTLLKEWLARLEQIELGIDRIKLQDNPNAAAPAPTGGIVPLLDQWLRTTSQLSDSYKSDLIGLLNDLKTWTDSYGADLDEYGVKIQALIREVNRLTVREITPKAEELMGEIREIYMELRTPVSSRKAIAIADGSSYEDMLAYIDELLDTKVITKQQKKDMVAVFEQASGPVIGRIRLRMMLKHL